MGLGNLVFKELEPAKKQTADGNSTGVNMAETINIKGNELVAFLTVGEKSGTSPTLDLKLQESADDSTYTDIPGATFTQATDATTETIRFRLTKKYLRDNRALNGTSPTFTYAVVVAGEGSFSHNY